MSGINIIEYKPEHQRYFEALNRAWIEKYFKMEERDILVLTQPEEMIINKGGAILIAEYDTVIAGTVALLKVDDKTYEFTKMAVDINYRRKGIAEELCYASFKKAKELGAEMIILFSNSILTGAIAMYEKVGFRHVALENTAYKRSDVKMIITVEDALRSANNFYNLIKV
ncbi:MAG: GNAT family N-acetyltransferase [Bacteroidia bacterium]|nr:GNAT family N-acetyltransferase [Bacteroidia bacterium]